VEFGPISSIDWLLPSWITPTVVPSGSRRATFSPENANPPGKSDSNVAS
jgi:hypothetical protein